MREAKRKRLEAAGWKVGSVKELLGLSDADMEFIEMRLSIARRIKQRREKRKLTQKGFAQLMKTSQSRVAKIEAADPSVSLDQMVRSLLTLGADRNAVGRAIAA